ncbi:hypothetical protein GCM10028895_22660 [Pontibacter rugosus]
MLSSLADETPEGKSIVELAQELNVGVPQPDMRQVDFIKFTAETRSSGINLANGTRIRKGAYDAIRKMSENAGNLFHPNVTETIEKIAANGGTPLVVAENEEVQG